MGGDLCFGRASSCASNLIVRVVACVLIGLQVDTLGSGGEGGCVVRSPPHASAVAKDGRLKAGDVVVGVNDESLRGVTSSQARAIIRRIGLACTDIRCVYLTRYNSRKNLLDVLSSLCLIYRATLCPSAHPSLDYGWVVRHDMFWHMDSSAELKNNHTFEDAVKARSKFLSKQ